MFPKDSSLIIDAVIPSLAASQYLCVISDVLRLSNGHQIVVVPRLLESIERVLREREIREMRSGARRTIEDIILFLRFHTGFKRFRFFI